MNGTTLLSTWHLDWLAACGLLGALATRRLRVILGGVLLVVALASPVAVLADGYLFSAHMLQHLLLVIAVPPLVLLGYKAELERSRLSCPPLVAWALGVGAMWLWHAPTLCNAAATSAVVQRAQQVSLLLMGAAFWLPVIGQRISPLVGVLYLFGACIACTLLGIIVTLSPLQVCSVFAHPIDRLGVMPLLRDGWGITSARDQQLGGLLMWVPACVVYASAIMAELARFYGAPERAHA